MTGTTTAHQDDPFARDWPDAMTWRDPNAERPWRTCGYCGSIHPEDFATIDLDRSEIADMKYGWPHKVYFDIRNPDPDTVYCVGGRYEAASGPYAPGGSHYEPPSPEYVKVEDLTEEQRAIAIRGGMLRPEEEPATGRAHYLMFGHRVRLTGKLYTVHLMEPGLDADVLDKCFARVGLVIERGDKRGSVQWKPYVQA